MPTGRANPPAAAGCTAVPSWRGPIQNDQPHAGTVERALHDAAALLASDPAGALERANGILAQEPGAAAFRLVAAALRALDRHDEAAQAEMEGIRTGITQPLKLARAAQQARRSGEARSIAEDYLRDNPDDLLAMTIAAEASLGLHEADRAEPLLRQVVDRAPAFPPANFLLANALIAQLRLREAAEVLEGVRERLPQVDNVKRFLADVRSQMNDPAVAAALYGEVLASGAANPADQYKHAQNLRAAGQRDESVAALRRTIAMAPLGGQAWSTLALYFPDELTDGDERQVELAIRNAAVHSSDLQLLQATLSVIEHRRGNHQAAFAAVASAKALSAGGPDYDPASLSRHVDTLIAAYTPDLFERCRSQGSSSDAPIFIVGMPRSGSTLVERILGQHSKIEALGEIPVMPRLVAAEQPDGTANYRSLLPDALTAEKLSGMSQWYLDRSGEYRHSDKPRFTDKYNGNWIRAGLIGLMFPNARILDVRRDPLDCCWSVFKSFLVDDYARDQRNLARYYADCVRLMDATAAAAPGHTLTVRYEDLVGDVEAQTRRILDFLGLDFERACVDFHLSTTAVTTPSSEQVRRPINSEGIGSAGPYRPWLQPLVDELDLALPKSA